MERSTVRMKNFNGHRLSHQQQPQPMEPYISLPPTPPLRNSSFSSYLRPNHHHIINNQAADDSELSIFDAQRYFNESNSIDSKVIISNRVSPVNAINNLDRVSKHRISSDVSALPRFSSSSSLDGYGRNYRTRSFNATPTASSEASWNSQTGLLSNPPGTIAVSMRNPSSEGKKRDISSKKWQLFGRKCPCSGKKSVQVLEKTSVVSETKTPAGRLYNNKQIQKSLEIPVEKSFPSVSNTRRISAENRFTGLGQRVIASGRPYDSATGFTFPILNQTSSMKLVLNNLSYNNTTPLEELPRESLEIFQPPSEEVENRVMVSRQSFTFPTSPGGTRMTSVTDDDVASDASSDLFEIESFSTQTTSYPMYNHRRDSLDEAASFNSRPLATTNGNGLIHCTRRSLDEPVTPSIAATECYEPSEASIDWSVTTAEGFDRGSVTNFSMTTSDVDEMAVVMRHESGVSGGGGGKKKGNGGGMLSCRCEKAVSVVGPNPLKCVAGSGMRHVNRKTCNVNNKPPLARSQSHTLSLPFAT